MLCESEPRVFYFTDHYRDYPTVSDSPVEGDARPCRTVAATALACAGVEGGGEEISSGEA